MCQSKGDDGLGKVVDLNQDNESYLYYRSIYIVPSYTAKLHLIVRSNKSTGPIVRSNPRVRTFERPIVRTSEPAFLLYEDTRTYLLQRPGERIQREREGSIDNNTTHHQTQTTKRTEQRHNNRKKPYFHHFIHFKWASERIEVRGVLNV